MLDNGLSVKETVPPGVIALPVLVSAIVAVHVAGRPSGTYTGEHLATVLADRKPTRTGLPAVLEGACAALPWPGKSPPYEAVIVGDPVSRAVGV